MFKGLYGFVALLVDVDEVLIENAVNAIEATIDLFYAFMSPGFVDNAGDTGVNDRGGAAALGDQ